MWRQVLGIYCERGMDGAFWAEPLNAVTNGAFLLAAIALWPRARFDGRPLSYALIALIFVIGVGSFLFHTLATRWSGLADVLPIALFMFTAVYALTRRGAGGSFWLGLLAIAGFIGLMVFSFRVGPLLAPGLGSTLGYMPAFLMLVASGAALFFAGRREGVLMLSAAAVFALSMTFRTLDRPFCDMLTIGDAVIGTHWLWHLLNAATLYLVGRALIDMRAPSTSSARAA